MRIPALLKNTNIVRHSWFSSALVKSLKLISTFNRIIPDIVKLRRYAAHFDDYLFVIIIMLVTVAPVKIVGVVFATISFFFTATPIPKIIIISFDGASGYFQIWIRT